MDSGIKVPVIIRPSKYTIYYEGVPLPDGDRVTFVHCDIHGVWNKPTKLSLKQDFASLVSLRSNPLYCLRHDSKQEKFIKMFGFTLDYPVEGHDLDVYKLEI